MAKRSKINTWRRRGQWLGGGLLVVIGVAMILGRVTDIPNPGSIFMFVLGLAFLVWGVLSRSGGLLIPGGILTGIGAGIILNSTTLGGLESPADGGVFYLAFAGGWALITLFSLINRPVQWWPLVPAVILALAGTGMLMGGAAYTIVSWTGKLWPLALIGIGVWIVFGRYKTQTE